METTCPKCWHDKVVRECGTALNPATGKSILAYWNCCLRCWFKWDGVADSGGLHGVIVKNAIFPATVQPRRNHAETTL